MVASVEEYLVLNKVEANNELIIGLSEIELRIDEIFKITETKCQVHSVVEPFKVVVQEPTVKEWRLC